MIVRFLPGFWIPMLFANVHDRFSVEENIDQYYIQALFLWKAFSNRWLVMVVRLQLGKVALYVPSFETVGWDTHLLQMVNWLSKRLPWNPGVCNSIIQVDCSKWTCTRRTAERSFHFLFSGPPGSRVTGGFQNLSLNSISHHFGQENIWSPTQANQTKMR